jgi:hypothetical protein
MTKSELFRHAHQITKMKNIAYYGSYQKAFGAVLRECYAQKLCYGFQIVEPDRLWA